MFRKATLLLRTLPHLRPWQVFGRILAPIRSRMSPPVKVPPSVRGGLQSRIPFLDHDPWNSREDLLGGCFTFLNRTEDLGRPLDWEASDAPLLWRFNLHYFHYLHLLDPEEQVDLCRSWIETNPSAGKVAWHPYPTSHRIVNWMKANLGDRVVDESLYKQAAHLRRNLETYVYGNHLIENARALVFAGKYFDDQEEAPAWLEKGLQILKKEAGEQFLSDGGHYERSPMYHALMLQAYLDVMNLLDENDPVEEWLAPLVKKMTDALVTMTHPDGRIALFNDSTHEIAPISTELQAYASDLGVSLSASKRDLPETGYYIHHSEDIYLIFDAGPGGPGHLMAHAHADMLSYELSIRGKRFVVDTGVFEYPAGEKRRLARSTMAHNTVCVEGTDQIECWGSFRVARRAKPHHAIARHDGARVTFEGAFDGYARLIGDGVEHHRKVTIDDVKREILVRDEITGKGRHNVESRFHFHPDVDVSEAPDLTRDGLQCRLNVHEGPLRWDRASYFPRFGIVEERAVAVIGGEVVLPVRYEYSIRY